MKGHRTYLFVALLTTLAQAAPALAQAPQADAGAERPDLRQSIRELTTTLSKLESDRARATGDNQAMLDGEIASQRDQLQDKLAELLSQVKELKKAGQDPSALIRVAQTTIASELRAVKVELKDLQRSIGTLRANKAADPEAELQRQAALAHSEAKRDRLFLRFDTATEQLRALGLDSTTEDRALSELLRARVLDARSVYQLALDQKAELKSQPAPTNDEEKAARTKSTQALDAKVVAARQSLQQTLELMERRGMETAEHRRFLIEASGEITADVLDKDVAIGLLQSWISSGRAWVVANGPRLIFKLIVFLLILVVFRLLAGFSRRIICKALSTERLQVSTLLREFFAGLGANLTMLLGVLFGLSQLGIELGPLLAGLGVAGFIVGFALQSTLSNFASGLMILIYRPYDVGDLISVAGETGKVAEMTLVSTTIRTLDHQRLVIPNNKVWGDVIRNVTAEPIRRVDLVFGIGYGDDVEKARRVLVDIVTEHDKVLEDPEPVVKLHSLGESSVDFVVRPWCKTDDYWDVHWDVTRAVKERFDAEGISIPFPQRDVHLYSTDKAA